MDQSPCSVESSVRAYQVLIRAYPASFQREYASEMALVFRDMATEAWREGGATGLVAMWCRVFADVAWSVSREHWGEFQRGLTMKTAAFAFCSVVLAGIAYHFVFALIALVFLVIRFVVSDSALLESCAPAGEWALILIPALVTGALLVRVKPFYKPMITAPLGVVVLMGLMAGFGGAAPWWAVVAYAIGLGLITLLGCLASDQLSRRARRPSIA